MGIKRVVDCNFWEDPKVMERFTPEDKLFFLYLLTNPHSNLLGIYRILPKQISFEIGYSQESVGALLDRFQDKYKMILYSPETRELAIRNYLRYGIIKGGKPVEDRLMEDIRHVEDVRLLAYVYQAVSKAEITNETVKRIIANMGQRVKAAQGSLTNNLPYTEGYVYGDVYVYGDSGGESIYGTPHDSGDDSCHDSSKASKAEKGRFKAPTLEEVTEYCQSRDSCVDPAEFWHHYDANGWKAGKVPMKKWKSAVITWEIKARKAAQEQASKAQAAPSGGAFAALARERGVLDR